MTQPLSPNSQAILLLTAPLVAGRGEPSPELFSLGEFNRLVRLLREKRKTPADLIGSEADAIINHAAVAFGRERLDQLLGRGFQLSQAVDRWNSCSIWITTRDEDNYPSRISDRLKEDAPPVFYGCGSIRLLESGGLAVVGSRQVDEQLISFTEQVGKLAATAKRTIISGGAKGIDRASMHGALQAGGKVIGVMADSLERAVLARDNREPLMEDQLVLISPYDPSAGFNVGHAMQRNKLIYALADAGLVVTSDFETGGTWAGAIEQLDRLHYVPVFVSNHANAGKGNSALLRRGGLPWPNPVDADEFSDAMAKAAATVAAVPQQEMLSFVLRKEPPKK